MTRAFVLPVFVVLVAAIGIIDAATAHAWDMVTLFAALGVLGIMLGAPIRRRREMVSIRADLSRYLADRASAGNESIGRVADRAVASYRAALIDGGTEPPTRPQ